ncbi:conserved hypothetical protein [Talaromyces stipitatus ATCC 10500]|uniref:Fungal lipase-type domain-containing protein n=1 Tax=Talaromyces stipitatus (strain ATCC 10500 / CBS 375.48 / QM 6759 / NRRL 1006) TaxID=441959 RepID=B8M7T7_TALSN|nr:uncharacterized protein TSTA_030790 [Talaromyces stipitatus ATCC 10500]EED19816.1 conserved hypothetical protein [Talaromyces stipitatus ATCC 10500]
MEAGSIPETPPPPYQTVPPTPTQTPNQSHAVPATTHGPSQINPNVVYTPAFGVPPHVHKVHPQYHANLITLPFRPVHHYTHTIPHQHPGNQMYYAHHVGGHTAVPAAPAPPIIPRPQQQRQWQSYLHLGSLSATLNDAGNLAVEVYDSLTSHKPTKEQYGGALDAVAVRLDDVLTSMDDGTYRVESTDLGEYLPVPRKESIELTHTLAMAENQVFASTDASASSVNATTIARIPGSSTNPFSKVYHYANAYTSSALPPLKLYFATWPLICLASTYSRRAYEKPSSKERQNFISGDWRRGTKSVVLKSIPLDEKNTIVLAIRGTQSFQDWAVNIRTEPTAPTNFLDDEGSLCHAGFLSVARKMIKPVAAQLRDLLQENPRRATCSLVLTGHSAGGAVASLLYCHMLSQTVSSELTELQDLFKRVHCVTFGAPPISLLPLQKPTGKPRYYKNIFFAFVNEGDPVARADKAYVRSLLELYARPDPRPSSSSLKLPSCSSDSKITTISGKGKPTWNVPEATLSLAGRIIVLRTRKFSSSSSPHRSSKHQGDSKRKKTSSSSSNISLEAVTASDAELRGLIFGDPLMHTMDLYAQRIEQLATKAVVGSSVP